MRDDSGEELAEMIRTAKGGTTHRPGTGSPRIDGLSRHEGPIPEGRRHTALVSYAGRLRAKGLTLREAEPLMLQRLADCAQPPEARSPVTRPEALDKLHDVYDRYPADRPVDEDGEGDAVPVEPFEQQVEREAHRVRVREAAREKVTAEKVAAILAAAPPYDAGLLTDLLAREPEPPARVDGLVPWKASALVVAQRKTGKTTYKLNLARCLITGEHFLGRFGVRPVTGRVALLNYEVSAAQIARWAHEAGVPQDRFYVVNLRGRRNPLADQSDRERLAAMLREQQVESLIVDPFGRAFTGTSQNDSGEVGSWLAELDTFARSEVGALDVILAAHAGWNGERSRGSTALEDWADSIITLVREPGEDTSPDRPRYMRAEGRDVQVDEDRLTYDPATRTLTLAGAGGRKQASARDKIEQLVGAVVTAVSAEPGINGTEVGHRLTEAGVHRQKDAERKALNLAVERGRLTTVPGQRGAKCYYPVKLDVPQPPPTPPSGGGHPPPPTPPAGEVTHLPRPPL